MLGLHCSWFLSPKGVCLETDDVVHDILSSKAKNQILHVLAVLDNQDSTYHATCHDVGPGARYLHIHFALQLSCPCSILLQHALLFSHCATIFTMGECVVRAFAQAAPCSICECSVTDDPIYRRGSAMTLVVLITSHSLSRPTGWGRSPTKYSTSVLLQGLFVQRFREEIGGLIMSTYGMYAYFLSLNVVAEVVESDVQVLRPWPILVYFSHLQCPAIVFEYVAMYPRLWRVYRETSSLHFFQELHDRYRIPKSITQARILTEINSESCPNSL
jgi:hypothetical protein